MTEQSGAGNEENVCPHCDGDHPSDRTCPRASRSGELVLDKYRITKLLGQGGMGVVYEARHELIGRRFAVKFLHPELARNGQIFARFRREARAAGAIENENIAAVTDFGTAGDGAPFLVMEYLEGEDLARLLARTGPLAVSRAVHAVIQACRGLQAAHASGIVHRDLKPENLFVARRGDGSDLVKVLDFGIAKLKSTENEEGASTRTGTTMGTAHYMPPEQARGQKDIDERADIYALGVILYELLSGQKPHVGDTYNAVLYHILTKPAPPLETLRARLPPGLAELVHRAMAFAPDDRHGSAAELASALAPFAGRVLTPVHEHPTAGPSPAGALTVATSRTAGPATVSQDTEAGWARSKAAWLVALGVVGLGTAAFVTFGRSKTPEAPATDSSETAAAPARSGATTATAVPSARAAVAAPPSAVASAAPESSAAAPVERPKSAAARRVLARRESKSDPRAMRAPATSSAAAPPPSAPAAAPPPREDNDLYKP